MNNLLIGRTTMNIHREKFGILVCAALAVMTVTTIGILLAALFSASLVA